jgi:hypothetical protein
MYTPVPPENLDQRTASDQDNALSQYARLVALPASAVLPTREARTYIRVGPATWERLRGKGLLPPAIHLSERLLGYRKADLDRYLASRTEQVPEPAAAPTALDPVETKADDPPQAA